MFGQSNSDSDEHVRQPNCSAALRVACAALRVLLELLLGFYGLGSIISK